MDDGLTDIFNGIDEDDYYQKFLDDLNKNYIEFMDNSVGHHTCPNCLSQSIAPVDGVYECQECGDTWEEGE